LNLIIILNQNSKDLNINMDRGTFDLYNPNLETTDYGKVFQKLVSKDGFSFNIIEDYNNEILNNLQKSIENTVIPSKYGTIHFRNVKFEKPRMNSNKITDLTPKMAREKIIRYFGDIYADIIHKMTTVSEPIAYIDGKPIYSSISNETTEDVFENQKIGSIPIMLGSRLCHLDSKSSEEKFQMGECFNDPLGYFIIRSERVIVNQENLRTSTFIIHELSKDPKCSHRGVITCPIKAANRNTGSNVTQILICKHSTLNLYLAFSKKQNGPINIFVIYRILGFKMNDAINQILSFIEPKHREKAKQKLAPTIASYQVLDGDDDVEILKQYLLSVRRITNQRIQIDEAVKDVEDDLLSNLETVSDKLLHLSMYVSRMVEFMMDLRALNDRDSFSNKKITTPGRNLSILAKTIWNNITNEIKIKVDDPSIKTARQIGNTIKPNEMKDQLSKAFGPNAWGPKRNYRKDNYTDSLKRNTPLAIISQIQRVNVPSSRQSKNAAVRMPHPSQLGFVCLYDTPEGEGLGLVKYLASSCYISLERDPTPILDIIDKDTNLNGLVFKNRDKFDYFPLTVNGIIEGWCIPEPTVKRLKAYKSQGYIEKDVYIFYNKNDKCVEIFCDGGRPCRPLLVVDENSELIIEKLNMWNASVDDLVRYNCIEYVDAREQEWIYLADSVQKVHERRDLLLKLEKYKNNPQELEDIKTLLDETLPYNYCEVDPSSMFSISAIITPQANRQAGPRTSFQCGMSRQALTQYHSNEYLRFDASYQSVYYPSKPLFQTDMFETIGMNAMPNGQILQCAIMAHPDNPEDGIIFKEEAIKYGNKLDNCKKFKFTETLKVSSSLDYEEKFERPPSQNAEPTGKYAAISDNGIPKLDAYVNYGDCIIGKVKKYNKNIVGEMAGQIQNVSLFAGKGEEGYIDRVLVTIIEEGQIMISVKVRQNRKYIPGDKLALRYSQKGTISKIVPARELPRVASGPLKGMIPDVFINVHSIPSRMTMNMIIEILVNKAASITGKFFNATTFRNFEKEMEEVKQTLIDYGLDPTGNEFFELPNGRQLKSKIFFGPAYYNALKHHVNDKIQMRARSGGVKPSTRQPVSGRANEGGLKIGEMERSALISHGASGLLVERMAKASDQFSLPICARCGNIAITKNTEDDPNPNICRVCKDKAKIGVIEIPYVIKLLIFYLQAASINLTFRTSEVKLPNGRMEERFLV